MVSPPRTTTGMNVIAAARAAAVATGDAKKSDNKDKKDEKDDKSFMVDLFRKAILHNDEYQEAIQEKAKNWELERIAIMDLLLMKLALTELIEFSTIPVKVTLNEYIELSKHFSTPKSNTFINGILDKLVADFKASGKIQKTGRGLLDA
jgi:N utilization substance protein B